MSFEVKSSRMKADEEIFEIPISRKLNKREDPLKDVKKVLSDKRSLKFK